MTPLFNVRVYGILIENGMVLVSDEIHYGKMITKFPGGGLQFGEGTTDCLKREFMEELNLPIEITAHFYTVDFFQPSAFDSSQQVVSIYYRIKSDALHLIAAGDSRLTLENPEGSTQAFRWLKAKDLIEDDFTFPIDKKVSQLIAARFTDGNN